MKQKCRKPIAGTELIDSFIWLALYSTKCSEIHKCETLPVTNQMERERHTSTKHLETVSVGLAGQRCVTLASDPPHTLLHNTTHPFLIPPPTHALLKVSLQLNGGGGGGGGAGGWRVSGVI